MYRRHRMQWCQCLVFIQGTGGILATDTSAPSVLESLSEMKEMDSSAGFGEFRLSTFEEGSTSSDTLCHGMKMLCTSKTRTKKKTTLPTCQKKTPALPLTPQIPELSLRFKRPQNRHMNHESRTRKLSLLVGFSSVSGIGVFFGSSANWTLKRGANRQFEGVLVFSSFLRYEWIIPSRNQ